MAITGRKLREDIVSLRLSTDMAAPSVEKLDKVLAGYGHIRAGLERSLREDNKPEYLAWAYDALRQARR